MSLPFASQKVKSSKITQAVILAGGAGTRLRPFTINNPKPMIPVNGKPFLEHLLQMLKLNNIRDVLMLTGYLEEKIRNYFQDGKKFGLNILYSHTPFADESGEELKSGIRIKNAEHLLRDLFLLMYCDNYWPLNLKKLHQHFLEKKSDLLVTVYSNKDSSTRNNTLVNQRGLFEKYDKLRTEANLNGVDIGYMIVDKKVLKLLPKENSKFEDVIFPELIDKKKLAGFLTDHKYYSIGDPDRVKQAAKYLKEKRIIFLDRDGVINKKAAKADYIKTWAEFEFLPGAVEGMKKLVDSGYKIFIITNQAGIARGMMTLKDLNIIHKNMKAELKKAGVKISGIYYCPHGWDAGCECRKPQPGLLHQASREHLIDLTKTFFIGDDIRDKQTGDRAGVKTILTNSKKGLQQIVYSLTK